MLELYASNIEDNRRTQGIVASDILTQGPIDKALKEFSSRL